jgi:predicted nucleic acid-binding protein
LPLSSTEHWDFFRNLRHGKPGLGPGELGALAVARFHGAILVTNDRQARQAAEEFDIPVHGGLGVLEYAVEVGRLSGLEAVAILEEMICQGAWISEELAELFKQGFLIFVDALALQSFGGRLSQRLRHSVISIETT